MSSAPQIHTQEISDADLDAVSGGIAVPAAVEVPLVGGVAGAVDADLLNGNVSGALGGHALGVAGLGTAATLSL
ncbi:hypothetical protein ABZ172_28855 [Streptomyces sp. NPDC006296]|uniref:hypothetical protein n=1 Tax=Streptomyces sp. NPDC006296 TaxID=3156746 RepID=UPI0033A05284